MENQEIVRKALIDKFEGVSNNEILEKYPGVFKQVAEMYSMFRSYLFALAKTHPKVILELLKSNEEVVIKSTSRGFYVDDLKRVNVALDVLRGNKYEKVAEKHNISIASARVTFMNVVMKTNLGIPEYYGKKQIIAEYRTKLEEVFLEQISQLEGD